MNWYIGVLKNYAGFSGRARRTEFWMFFLFNVIAGVILGIIGAMIHTNVLSYIYELALLVPTLAVGARRLHDTGKSGWLQLIGVIPFVGWIVLIVLWALPGNPSANQYGADPKMVTAAA